ncbi:unnamed protein product [Caenorhabditis nigoni]
MDQDTKDYFQQEMRSGYNVGIEDIPALSVLYFHPRDGSIRWNSIMYTASISFIMTVQYGIMVYCGWNMQAKMEETIQKFSNTLKRHHRQLFRTLVFQITCPTIFLFSPLVIIMYLPFFGIECSFPAGVVFSAISVYPIIDSIIVLIVVSEYRVVVKSMWIFVWEQTVKKH